MKILLISHFFPPTHTTGAEKRAFGYASRLQGLEHQVQVVCAGTFDQGERYWNGYTDEVYRRIPVRRIHLNWILAPDPNQFLYCNSFVKEHLAQWLEEWRPDVVHITSCYTLSASVIEAVKARNIPIVLTLTDFWFTCPKLSLLRGDGSLCDGCTTAWDCLKCMLWDTKTYRGLSATLPEPLTAFILTKLSTQPILTRRRGLRGMALNMEQRKLYLAKMIEAVDIITAPSKSLQQTFEAAGVSKPIRIIRSGHDLAWLETLPPKKSAAMIRIGYIGQIAPIKGLHILIPAFMANGWTNQAQLSIFGDCKQYPDYMQYLEKLVDGQTANINFYGSFPHEQLGETLSQLDVLVVPSQWHENNPRVIQEAFAGKTPVIAANVRGISEFVQHNVNGLLFQRDDVNDLAHQLQRVITEPDLLEKLRLGIPAVKTVEEEVQELVKIYEHLIERQVGRHDFTDR